MNVNDKIRQLMNNRGWSEYRLAKEAGLSQSTISNLFNRNTVPSIATLNAICAGFGITLGQFFSDGNLVELTEDQKEIFDLWLCLSKEQKEALQTLLKTI